MSQPKGKVPAHIKPIKFQHPNETDRVILILNEVEDQRKPSCNFHHSLTRGLGSNGTTKALKLY